jgi:multiple sugar transport system permease protein
MRSVSQASRDRWRHLPAVILSVLFGLPLLVMVTGSLRPAGIPPARGTELFASSPTLENYPEAFDTVDLARQLTNSLIVALIVVPFTIVVASWAGLAISRLRGRTAGLLIGLSLVTLMIPATALIVGRFAIFSQLGLTNTLIPLVAPALMGTSPFFVLFFAWSFRRIPPELFDAARLEGAGWLSVWWRVALPLVRPTVAAVAVLAFTVTWASFLEPLVYLSDPSLYTVPIGLKSLSELPASDGPIYLAAAVVATVPPILAFLAVQRMLFSPAARNERIRS